MTGATQKLGSWIKVQMKRVIYILIIFLFMASITITGCKAEEDNYNSQFCITNISPTELRPAESSILFITIKNIGNHSVYSVTTDVLVEDISSVKIVGRTKKSVGYNKHDSIGKDREATVQYGIYVNEDAEIGVYYIPLKVVWNDESEKEGNISYEILNAGIKVTGGGKEAKIDISNVTTVPEVLKPGDEGTLRIQLKNIGYSTINSLKVSLSAVPPFTPIESDLDEYIPTLESNETAVVIFNLGVDSQAESKHYNFCLQLEYEDKTARVHHENSTIGVKVQGQPRINIQEIVDEPSKPTTETEGLFRIRLLNTGTESAENVEIAISGTDDIHTEEHQFIGAIAPGQSKNATFGGPVVKEAGIEKHGLKLSISYEDKFGASYFDSKIYEISIFSPEPYIPMEFIYVLTAIVVFSLIVYLIIAVRYRKEE